MTDTRHLDTMIALLKGSATTPAPRGKVVTLAAHPEGGTGDVYIITVNGKLTTYVVGRSAAEKDLADRAEAARKLGLSAIITVH